eukprot:Pgem_evm1s5596
MNLTNLRNILIGLEDLILFAFIERGQYDFNTVVYQPYQFDFVLQPFSTNSLLDNYLQEIELLQSKYGRYKLTEETPFSKYLLSTLVKPQPFPKIEQVDGEIFSFNHMVKENYLVEILPLIVNHGNKDNNYAETVLKDVKCLQLLSQRVNWGKYVAEVKYYDPLLRDQYDKLIKNKDEVGIEKLLTNTTIEKQIYERVKNKVILYNKSETTLKKLVPENIASIFEKVIIPITKKVEVEYFKLKF